MQAALVGRHEEFRVLADAAARACSGDGNALLVRGEAGIGKSALLDRFAADLVDSMQVLRVRGYESEVGLPFAGLTTVVEPLLHYLGELPEPQSTVLRVALAIEAASGYVEPFAVAAASHALLAAAGEARPLLVIIDDAHWLDGASAEALLFAARRLERLPALILFAARDGEAWPRALDTLPSLELRGLDDEQVIELLAADPEHPVAFEVAHELTRRALGNPLALLELQAVLDEPMRTGVRALDDPLPVGDAVKALFLRRARLLPPATQHALLWIAADNEAPPPPAETLEPAERAGLVGRHAGRYEFHHPLVRSAVYHGAADPDRRRIHGELAARLDGTGARRALHAALAATAPDESIAGRLEREAESAMARAGVAESARLLELAAELSPEATDAVRRYAAAAKALLFAGDLARATHVSETARHRASDPRAEAVALHAVATAQLWRGETMPAHRTLVEAAERVERLDSQLAASLFADAVQPAFTAAEIRPALYAARRASALVDGTDPVVAQQANLLHTSALVLAGKAGTRDDAREQLRSLVPPTTVLDPLAAGYALALVWLEDAATAKIVASDAIARAEAVAATTALPLLLAARAEADLWLGNARAAFADGLEAVSICESLGGHVAAPYALTVLARAEATIGLDGQARAHAEQALALGRPVGLDSIEYYAAAATGLADVVSGRYEDALARLAPLRHLYRERGVAELAAVPWHGDLIEAAIRAGDLRVVQETLADLEEAAARTHSRWTEGVAVRARAELHNRSEAEADFEHASALLEQVPIEWARTRLAYGSWLRRERRRTDARQPLREAAAALERAGATGWAKRARDELAAAGGLRQRTSHEAVERLLSAQELRVALLVAEGATNREAASRMFVSPKTIEYHLANAYRKLGVRSRVELARRLSTTETSSESPQ